MTSNTTTNDHDLLSILKTEFPDLIFCPAKRFSYRYPKTIYYETAPGDFDQATDCKLTLGSLGTTVFSPYLHQFLHELGHALSGHKSYKTDIKRLKLEREAWDRAEKLHASLSKKYPLIKSIPWDSDFVELSLDTYRDWLHNKSRCPRCGLTRVQDSQKNYHCPRCDNFC